MSAKASPHAPKTPYAVDGHGSGSHRARGRRNSPAVEADNTEAAAPPPLPSDPATLAQIRAEIDRGLAQARAGLGYDLDEVLADMDRKIAAHSR